MTLFRPILRILGWGVVVVLGSVFLFGYAAPYLSPTRFWWTDLFAVVLPFVSIGVAGLSVVIVGWGAYARKWGRLVLGTGLLLLLIARFGPRLSALEPSIAAPHGLRLMTFNVPPSMQRIPASETPLMDLVRREQPDVLAIQESRVRTSSGRVQHTAPSIRTLVSQGSEYRLPQVLPKSEAFQQPVVGTFSLDSLSVHPLPPDGGSSPRSRYTRTRFSWQGRPVVLYNVHLHSVGQARPWTFLPDEWTSVETWRTFLRTYRDGALRRAQQARLIRRHIEREAHPVIVVGDFNSTPHQWAYWHIARGLQNAVTRRVRGWGGTFPAGRPLVRIDHVLADPAWQITRVRIPSDGAATISDHRPVYVQLRWKGDGSR